MTYAEYLKSPLWAKIRRRVLKRDGQACRSCGRRATQVHHGEYTPGTMSGSDLTMLFAICGPCHLEATFGPTGKRSPDAVRQWALDLLPKETKQPIQARRPRKGQKHRCVCGNLRKHNRTHCRSCRPR